jgi:integral membrane protein (TIGR01906 family)
LAGIAAAILVVLVAGARRMGHMRRAWSAIAAGMRGLIVAVVIAGVIAAVAFDQVFELFHELFFPAGSFTFDPRTDHLVQLFPFDFWSETTIVLGVVIVAIAGLVALGGGHLARRAAPATGSATSEPVVAAGASVSR